MDLYEYHSLSFTVDGGWGKWTYMNIVLSLVLQLMVVGASGLRGSRAVRHVVQASRRGTGDATLHEPITGGESAVGAIPGGEPAWSQNAQVSRKNLNIIFSIVFSYR